MRWIVTLSGSKQDTERLAAEIPELSRSGDAPRELLLELDDPEGDAADDAPHAAKAAIDASVRRLNGFARLRWGWSFEGVSVSGIKSIDSAGLASHQVFIEPAVDHMLPEDYAHMVERLGHRRPELPARSTSSTPWKARPSPPWPILTQRSRAYSISLTSCSKATMRSTGWPGTRR